MLAFAAVNVTAALVLVVAPVAEVPDAAVPNAHFTGLTPWFATVHPLDAKVFPTLKPPSKTGLIIVVCACNTKTEKNRKKHNATCNIPFCCFFV